MNMTLMVADDGNDAVPFLQELFNAIKIRRSICLAEA